MPATATTAGGDGHVEVAVGGIAVLRCDVGTDVAYIAALVRALAG